MVGSATPCRVVLGYTRRQAVQAMRSSPVSNIPLGFLLLASVLSSCPESLDDKL